MMVEKEVKFKISVEDEATAKLQEIKSQMDALNRASYQLTARFASQPQPAVKGPPSPSAEQPTIKPEMDMPEVPGVSIPSSVEQAEIPKLELPKIQPSKVESPEVVPAKVPEIIYPEAKTIAPPEVSAPKVPPITPPEILPPEVNPVKAPEIAYPEIPTPKVPSVEYPSSIAPTQVPSPVAQPIQVPTIVQPPKIPPVTPRAISYPVQQTRPPIEENEYPKYMTGRDISSRETLKRITEEGGAIRGGMAKESPTPEKKKSSSKKKEEIPKENMMIQKEWATPLRAVGAYRSAWFAGQDTSKGPMKAAAGLFILQAVSDGIQKIIQILSQASPLLRAEIKVLRIATEQMLRPIGDLLGTVLRPLSRSMLKANAAARLSMSKEGIPQTDLSQYYARFTAAMAAQASGEEVLGENAVDMSNTVTALDGMFKFLSVGTLPGLIIAFTDVMTWVDENKDMFPMLLTATTGIVTDVVNVQAPLRQLTNTVIDLNKAVQGLCGVMKTVTDVSSGAAGVLGSLGDMGDIGKTVENTFSNVMGYLS